VIRRSGVASDTVALGLQRRMNHDCFPLVLDKIVRGGQITAVDRQIGVAYGAAAVRGLVEGHTGEMVGIQPQHLTYVPMADSVNQVHTVPPGSEFLTTARLLGISLGAGGVSA
jgi:6-phosphofructokinase 1